MEQGGRKLARMRLLLIIILCLNAAAQSPKQHTSNKQHTQPQVDKTANNQSVSDTSKTPETQFYTYNNQKEEGNETTKEIGDYLLAAFTGALVIVSLMQWGVLRKHEDWMRRNVAVVTEIAGAAKKNADAIVDSERAWVIASPAQNAPELGFIPPPTGQPEFDGVDTPNSFSISFKNTGKTPALLTDSAMVYRLFNRLEDIPTEPEYGTRGPLNGLPLVKGDSVGAFAFLQPNIILSYDVAQAVGRQEAFLCAYGIIAYQDVFYRSHETRFGYIYHFPLGGDPIPAGFRREKLPTAYNRAT